MIHIKTAVNKAGDLQALEIRTDFDCGAYSLLPEEIIRRNIYPVAESYPCKHMAIRVNLIKTNAPPVIPAPAFGSGHIFTALESEMNRLVETANRSPADMRFHFNPGVSAGEDGGKRLLEELVRDSDFSRKYGAYEMMKKRRAGKNQEHASIRGIGIALASQGNGFTTPLESKLIPYIAVRLDAEKRVTIITSAAVRPRSIAIAWKELAAEILDLPTASVDVDNEGLEQNIDSGPSILGRNVSVLTPLVRKCCEAIQKKRFRSPLPIEVKRSARIPSSARWDEKRGNGRLFASASLAASVVELEYDAVTLETELREIWLYALCGAVLSMNTAKEAIESGILHALDWAAGRPVWFRDGAASGHDPSKGNRIRPVDMHIRIYPEQKRIVPGAVENLPYTVVPPAFLSALSQAGNVNFDSIPQNPETILKLMEER